MITSCRRLVFTFLAFALLPLAAAPPAEEIKKLQDLNEQIRVALDRGDIDKAGILSSNLMLAIYRQRKASELSPADRLAKLEKEAPVGGAERFYALADLAKTAFDAGALDKALQYANELLALAPAYPKDWNYGNAVFVSNMVIGRVALKRDSNLAMARTLLLASGKTPGSPQLNSFGPNMSLARDLLNAGDRDTVLEFFAECGKFWKDQSGRLNAWTAQVKGGGVPEFGANLKY